MTKKEKDLLLKELCAILPYKTLLDIDGERVYLVKIDLKSTTPFIVGEYYNNLGSLNTFAIEQVKPYLRPMSSMSEDEKNKFQSLQEYFYGEKYIGNNEWENTGKVYYNTVESLDWLNANHFDYRHLIEKCLALKATKGMYEIQD